VKVKAMIAAEHNRQARGHSPAVSFVGECELVRGAFWDSSVGHGANWSAVISIWELFFTGHWGPLPFMYATGRLDLMCDY
jgi:hypothetical protein